MTEKENFEFDFEKLKVYQKALNFIHKVFLIHKTLQTDFKYSIGNNIVRASLSIANNIAEGSGKPSKREKARYYEISLDSARECISVLNVLKREDLICRELYIEMRALGREITSMITGLMRSIK